ncbi:MAG: type II toxin-antitoxin system VapC family toxin [Deltaproteobacteria bacterium]
MGIILDTGILIAYERGNLDIDKLVKDNADEPFGLSAITVSELLHGVHRADSESRKLKREAFVQKVIDTFPIYPFDISAARIYADVWASLLKKGVPIGAHDLLIAATAISLGFSVATHNVRDFNKIKGLTLKVV